MILAAIRSKDHPSILCEADDQGPLFRDLLSALSAVGYAVVKPCVIDTDAPAQIKSCLHVARQWAGGSQPDMVVGKIDVALAIAQALEDYLRELNRLGTMVPVTWAEWVQLQYSRKFVDKAEGCVKTV
jgi:hypothetical protein